MDHITRILKYSTMSLLAIIPFLPLYVANSNYFPFITGKGFAFRILVEIAFVLWVILVLREKGTPTAHSTAGVAPRVSALTIGVTVFTVIALIADLLGLSPLRSIWSNFERMEGWITIIHLWMYFMVLAHIFGSKEHARKNWHTFLTIVLGAGLITAFYGLFQYFGWAETHQGATRVDASLGNSAYMAVYMLMNAGIALYMALVHISKKVWMYTYVVLTAFFSFILFQTATRGTILGWIGAILLGCAIYALWGRKERGQSNLSRGIAGGAIGLVILLGVLFYFNRDAQWIRNNNVLTRLASISLTETKGQARGYIWPMAIKGTFETPKTAIFGVGQENFNYLFNSHYDPRMWSQEQWFDRAHSVFLDWLVAGGLLGFLSYLALYVLSLVYVAKSNLSLGEKAVLIATLVGYGIHNIFVFDNQTSYIMFFTILAFLAAHHGGKGYSWLGHGEHRQTETYTTIRDYAVVPVLVLVLISALYFVNIRVMRANTTLIAALQACGKDNTIAYAAFKKALSFNSTTANQEIREQLITCASNVIRSNNSVDVKGKFYDLTKEQIEQQLIDGPDDARTFIIAGGFFSRVGDAASALPLLTKAHELSPKKQTISFELISYYLNSNQPKEAVALAEETYNLATNNETARIIYVSALIFNDQEQKAHQLFDATNPEVFSDQRIISIYAYKKDFAKVIQMYTDIIKKDQTNPQLYMGLASAYLAQGQTSQSLETLRLMQTKFPESKQQVDTLIQQIQAGKNPFQ